MTKRPHATEPGTAGRQAADRLDADHHDTDHHDTDRLDTDRLDTDADLSPVAPRWPAWVRVIAVVLLFIGTLLATAAITAPLAMVMPETQNADLVRRIIIQVLFAILLVVALRVFLRVVERRPLSWIGVRFTRWSLPLLLVGAAVSAVVTAVAVAVMRTGGAPQPGEALVPPGTPTALIVVLAITQGMLLQGLPEELVYRGYMIRTLAARPVTAVVTSVLVFTVLHLVSNSGQSGVLEHVLYLATPFGFAVSAAGLALLLRSIWAAVGIHSGFHWALMVASTSVPTNEPAMWLALGAGHTLVGMAALAVWLRRGATVDYVR